MDRNEPAWIVMAAIHQHHAHAEFANHLLVKGLQTTIVVKAGASGEAALSKTLAQVRPWSLMVVVASDHAYVADILTSFR